MSTMRINKYLAQATGQSRRSADLLISSGRVQVNGLAPSAGQQITERDRVTIDALGVKPLLQHQTILLNKPVGFVVSREGQGSKTVYDLLPKSLHRLKPIGRLDKDSSGLLLMSDDGQLAQELTHPRYQKTKSYEISLDLPLQPLHRQMISDFGISLTDGISKLQISRLTENQERRWLIKMQEGRNRQIRRTFEALGYRVTTLHRISFGNYALHSLRSGSYEVVVGQSETTSKK